MEAHFPTGEGLTFEKVWLMFQETDRKIQEADRKFQKMKLEAEERREKERKEMEERREKERKEMDKERKRMDLRLAQEMAKTNAILGRLGNKLGEFVEGFVRPGIVRLFNERGISITQTARNLEVVREGQKMEVDIIGMNGSDVVVVEVKSTLNVEDVKEHLERLESFKQFFPQYADKQVFGAVACMVMGTGVDKFAYRQGLFIIAQAGDAVHLLNDEKFQPKLW